MLKMKNIEIEILKILENNGRASEKDISTMLGIDESTVRDTIKKLMNSGVLKKFTAVIDWKKIGSKRVNAMLQVKVVPQEREGFARTCKEISLDKRVKDLFVMTGEYDVVLNVEAEDIDEIAELITEKIAPKKEVVGTNTHIMLSEFKRDYVSFFDEKDKRISITL